MNLVEALGAEIGPRTAGSEEAGQAAEIVAEAFRGLGLEPRFQEFDLLVYEPEEPELEVGGARVAAGPCMYSHPGEVEGPLRRLSDGVWAVGERGRVFRSPFGVGAIPFLTSGILGGHLTSPPAVFVSPADEAKFEEGVSARLVVRGEFLPNRRDRNVIADLPGEREETVVVGAHYDSVWRGPGVIDNATGVEGLRRVAERLRHRAHPRSLTFVAFGAEEISLIGSKYFVREARDRDELRRIVGMVNLDCIGHGENLEILASPVELLGRAREAARSLGLLDRYRLVTEIGDTAGTDHLPFAQNDIPAVTVLHFPYPEYHLPAEALALVDEQRMADAVELAVALVESQLADPVSPKS